MSTGDGFITFGFQASGSGGAPPVPPNTIYSADGIIPSDRFVDSDGNDLSFIAGKQYLFRSESTPSSGSSFTIQGFGITSGDSLFSVKNGDGDISQEWYGNKSTIIKGKTSIFNDLGQPYLLQVDAYSAGLNGIFIQSNGGESVIANSNGGTGIHGLGNVGVLGDATNIGIQGIANNYGQVGIGGAAGGYFYSNAGGWGFIPYENPGSSGALNCSGKALFNGTASTGSALVQIDSSTQGVLLPRMTTIQINAILFPAEGLEVFNTTISQKCVFRSGAWAQLVNIPM